MASIAATKFDLPEGYFDTYADVTFREAGAIDINLDGCTLEITLSDSTVFALARATGKYGEDILTAYLRQGERESVTEFMEMKVDASQIAPWEDRS